jgi:hypothetical protein
MAKNFYNFTSEELLLLKAALSHYLSTTRRDYRAGMVDSDDYDYIVDSIFAMKNKLGIELDIKE